MPDSMHAFLDRFFLLGEMPPITETGAYIPHLVFLSYIVASLGSFTGLQMADSIHKAKTDRLVKFFQLGGAFTFGTGIWSMHFIGMLAYDMDMVISYDPFLTTLSFIIAVTIAYGVLEILRQEALRIFPTTLAALLLGMAICGMHYTGMSAMRMDADLRYTPWLFFLSFVIAVTASGAALWIVFTLGKHNSASKLGWQILAALIMGAAICGMHYTGMEAAVFIPHENCLRNPDQSFRTLAIILALASGSIFAVGITVSLYQSADRVKTFWQEETKSEKIGQKLFFHLFTLLSLSIMLYSASYAYVVYMQKSKVLNTALLSGVSLQEMLIERYIHEISTLITTQNNKDSQIMRESKEDSEEASLLIDKNFESLLDGGEVFLSIDGNKTLTVPPLSNGELRKSIQKAKESWLSFRTIGDSLLSNHSPVHVDSEPGSVFSDRKLQVIAAQETVLQTIEVLISTSSEQFTLLQNIAFIGGLTCFFITLIYAYFRISKPVNELYEELRDHRNNLEHKVSEQTADIRNAIQETEEARKKAEDLNTRMQGYIERLEDARMDAITSRNRSDEDRKRLSIILDTAAEGIYGIDKNGYTTIANPAAEKMLGYTLEEMKEKPQHHIIHHSHADGSPYPIEECNVYRALREGKKSYSENEVFWRKDGTCFPVAYNSIPLRNESGEITGAVVSFRDISESKEREDLLTQAKTEAENASRAKSNFLANMSHEIRTPMNAILGMSNLMLDTKLDSEQREWANAIKTSGDTLLTIINDIIDISKIEAGKLVLENIPFDLYDVIQDVAELYAYQAQEKKIELLLDLDTAISSEVVGDPVRMRQILANLVSNALKFTSEGHVAICARKNAESSDGFLDITFVVEDTGIGIPKNKQSKIFEKFTQAEDSTTRKFGGTGLGLTIVSELISLMGGSIHVESVEGRGSKFIFTLHMKAGDQKQIVPLLNKRLSLHALIVDDYPLTRELLHTTIVRTGMTGETVTNAEEALALLQSQKESPYDVCLIDQALGNMSGLDLVSKIRKDPSLEKLALILVSGMMDRTNDEDLKALGLDGYFKKPFHPSQILVAVQMAVGNRQKGILDAPLITRHNATIAMDRNRDTGGGDTYRQYRGKTVLAVDDMKMNMMLIKKVLSKFGLQIDTAADGNEALEKAKEKNYDAIFMDCQMPVMDGFTASRQIRAFEEEHKRQRVPIIALTADAMVGDREKCLHFGMDDYINKPFRESQIASALEKWIGEHGKPSASQEGKHAGSA